MLCLRMCILVAWVLAAGVAQANPFDHSLWNNLLQKHVEPLRGGSATVVDYAGFKGDREQLKRYLNQLSAVSRGTFEQWSTSTQLAFLINAYNAWTVELILTEWPDLDSIKDLGGFFTSPWKKRFIPLLGEKRTLDDIEHEMIRGWDRYQEPRIHFAVNCASLGCPALRREAYSGPKLNAQLEEQTHLFLADRSRNRLEEGTLRLSPIFDWYREDFEKGWQGYDHLSEFLLDYSEALDLTPKARQQLKQGKLDIAYTDYDWSLNDKK